MTMKVKVKLVKCVECGEFYNRLLKKHKGRGAKVCLFRQSNSKTCSHTCSRNHWNRYQEKYQRRYRQMRKDKRLQEQKTK